MTERENGWYLRSDGYMTSEFSYQRIEAMKGNRALDNHQKLVFVKFIGGEEKDSRVYVPHPGTCENANKHPDYFFTCSECGCKVYYEGYSGDQFMLVGDDAAVPKFCPNCGKAVKR